MTAIRKDITIEQGADFDQPFFLCDQGGTPVNLSNATAVMQIRLCYSDPTALVTLSSEDGSLVINGRQGTITPYIAGSVTQAMMPGIYVYDLKLQETDGRLSRAFQGDAYVSPEVTTETPLPVGPSPSPAPSPSPPSNDFTEEDGTTPLTEEGSTTPFTQE